MRSNDSNFVKRKQEIIVKSQKKIRSFWFVVGFLAGAALAATADNRIDFESARHDTTLALATATTGQSSSRNCLGSNCSANMFTTLSRADVPPGLPGLAPSGAAILSAPNINRFNGSLTGSISLKSVDDKSAGSPSNFAVILTNSNPQPQLHFTTATMTRGSGSPYLQGSGSGIGSFMRQLFCSSPTREDCISENLFNTNPTIKSTPTGKVTLAPEPTAAFLVGTGLLALGLIRRRQKTNRT